MEALFTDFNGAAALIANAYSQQWLELQNVITTMPLYLKASDQNSRRGKPIFDPIATNSHFCSQLVLQGWHANAPIPQNYDFLGKGVDFAKNGVITEIQFSNYPFLLNNIVRSELFHKSKTVFHGGVNTSLIFIVTKLGCLPASNSTLYYEQALDQLNALIQNGIFNAPVRLIGLYESTVQTQAQWSTYSGRYAREFLSQSSCQIRISTTNRNQKYKIEVI